MTRKKEQNQHQQAAEKRLSHPEQWATGDEPMTDAQRAYLNTLARQAGEDVEDDLTKAEASEKIDELRDRTGVSSD